MTRTRRSEGSTARAACCALATACIALTETPAMATTTPLLPQLNWVPGSDWVNVKDYGVKGDGVADDTAAIQAVFDKKLVVSGPPIWFPAGTYRITKTLVIGQLPQWGGMILGNGRDTKLVWDGAIGGTMIQKADGTFGHWEGLDLDGKGVAAHGIRKIPVEFETTFRWRHMAFRNFTDACVLMDDSGAPATAEVSFENSLFDQPMEIPDDAGQLSDMFGDNCGPQQLAQISAQMDDMRQLGRMDLALDFPDVLGDASPDSASGSPGLDGGMDGRSGETNEPTADASVGDVDASGAPVLRAQDASGGGGCGCRTAPAPGRSFGRVTSVLVLLGWGWGWRRRARRAIHSCASGHETKAASPLT